MQLILVETPKDGTRTFTNRLQEEISNFCHNDKLQSQQLFPDMKIDYIAFPEQSERINKFIDTAHEEQMISSKLNMLQDN